jgi:uncharacterized membrane protein
MIGFPLYLLMPVIAAAVYAVGALLFKEAFRRGASTLHTFVVTSWMMALFFTPFIFWETKSIQWNLIHYPILTACAFFIGHWITFTAIRVGDVSLVTPVMGTKSVFVAFFAWLVFQEEIAGGMWMAAILTSVAVYILGKTDLKSLKNRMPLATGLTITSSACFGLCDALVQEWATLFVVRSFLTLLFLTVALLSTCLVPFFEKPLRQLDKGTLGWLTAGAFLTGLQAIFIALSVSLYHNATGVNVVYSSRGLWAIILVWASARFVGKSSEETDARKLLLRFTGATLMCVAILLAVMESK